MIKDWRPAPLLRRSSSPLARKPLTVEQSTLTVQPQRVLSVISSATGEIRSESNEISEGAPVIRRVRTKDADPFIVDELQSFWKSRSSSAENTLNEHRLLELKRNFTAALLTALVNETPEPGIVGHADEIVARALATNQMATMTWLNSIYLDNYSNSRVAADILTLVGRLPYERAIPAGPTMALGGLSHMDPAVQEAAIRAFERWADSDSLRILESVNVGVIWLRDYLDSVKRDIKEQLCLD